MSDSSDDDSPPPPLVRSSPSADIVARPGMVDSEDEVELEAPLNVNKCQDLFSKRMFESARECLRYCKNVHGFNLKILRKRHSLDCFSFIRMVNYLRKEQPSPGLVMSLSSDTLWKDEAYMKPTVEDDPLLMVDIEEDLSDLDEEEESEYKRQVSSSENENESEVKQACNLSCNGEVEKMKEELALLRRQLETKNRQLELALIDMDKMRKVTKAIFEDGDAKLSYKVPKSVGELKESGDGAYGGSYAHFGIHHEMLSDKVRTQSYKDAVCSNSETLKGKKVLDLGSGTGILSMFCAREGLAGQVVGVDMSNIAHQAMEIVMENNLHDKVTILKGRLEDLDLKSALGWEENSKFEVLISEWMGYFLLFEGMLDSVIAARDKYLTGNCIILPNRCTMHLVGICDEERYAETAGYFEDVYGYKMSCMRGPMIKEASVEVIPQEKVVTSIADLHELDMNKCSLADTEFKTGFSMTVTRDAEITCFAGYFDAFFDDTRLKNPVTFSTGPHSTPTHWKQTIFYLEEKFPVTKGQIVKGAIHVTRPTQDVRSLDVNISLDGRKSQKFTLD